MRIAIPLLDGFTALDVVGPYEVLRMLPGSDVVFVGAATGPYADDNGALSLVATATFSAVTEADVLVVPGGPGAWRSLGDESLLDWIRGVHASAEWTTSVCTGSLLLGAAGLLDGLEATTHWGAVDALESYGATYTGRRVVEQPGGIVTAAGVSSGIDMALRLAELIAGRVAAEAFQLAIEYDPQPPFDSGSYAKASQEAKDYLAGHARGTVGPKSAGA
ncbi:glutamine amidotransferase [Planotetraspora thailandica]|uniref:Glutamine amidotransferase n=1 Tax=Planotetraspora thailandica TaxID=487172 RepID=A0A8J3XUI2_9ACTN|nr:DJ-1/PfpI family protein [Planotetraspora thailandica]GII53135.1 glutamine amidotransferase [Planotetraspora thailandica]